MIANEALAGSVAPSVIGGESVLSGVPDVLPSKILSRLPEQLSARPLYVNSPWNFLATCLQVFQKYPVPTKELSISTGEDR